MRLPFFIICVFQIAQFSILKFILFSVRFRNSPIETIKWLNSQSGARAKSFEAKNNYDTVHLTLPN